MTLASGAQVGRYRIVAALGAGGMGEVYRAEDTSLGRQVAIKMLPTPLSGDPERLARFEREARVLASLDHPNIVTVFSVEHVGTHVLLTMELVRGKTLAQLIPSSGMPLGALLAVAIPLADALASAHRRGVIHRDLKPANVMVSDEGRVKVLDFGLAGLEETGTEAAAGTTVEALSREGQIAGTLAYMSPEQADGKHLDHRTDIFSLGTILFEMATGRRPFTGASRLDVLVAIVHERPQATSDLNAEMPREFDGLVTRCLEKDRGLRTQTAREVWSELKAIKEATESGARSSAERAGTPASARQRRVAVLPFVNMSADPEQQYFCDGMAEEIINALAHVEGLEVAARTSAFAFKGQDRDIREIGRLLDVGSALEGSVRRAGNRLRITAQLVRVSDGMHLWSEKFDRELQDVFAIQDEISLAIVDRLKVQLLAGEKARVVKRHTEDQEAHSLYLKGSYFFKRRLEGDMARAMACYEQAVARDPQYALPQVGLSDALMVMGQWGMQRPAEVFPRAKAEAERALAIDEELAEAHAIAGYIATIYDWDWASAERHFTRAVSLNPREALTRHLYALYLCMRERFGEALCQSRQSLELEPVSATANAHAGQVLLYAGRPAEAIDQAAKAIELDPDAPLGHYWASLAYLAVGRLQDASEAAEKAAPKMATVTATAVAMILARQGRLDEARRVLVELEEHAKAGYVSPFLLAFTHAALGDLDAASACLEKAFTERDPLLPHLKLPRFGREALLADARVQAIIRKVGLPL
jgi:TolB-like protein/Flp pilus assembly protein TadD